jgi:hypothetical protein
MKLRSGKITSHKKRVGALLQLFFMGFPESIASQSFQEIPWFGFERKALYG